MKTSELYRLLELYKKALEDKLTVSEFQTTLHNARIEIDKSFVQTGKQDEDLAEYIEELIKLQESINI